MQSSELITPTPGTDVEEARAGSLERLPKALERRQHVLGGEPEEAGRLPLGDEDVGVEVIPAGLQRPGSRAAQGLGASAGGRCGYRPA